MKWKSTDLTNLSLHQFNQKLTSPYDTNFTINLTNPGIPPIPIIMSHSWKSTRVSRGIFTQYHKSMLEVLWKERRKRKKAKQTQGNKDLDCFQSTSGSPCPPSSPPVGPLSLTTRPEDQQPPSSTPSSVKQEDARVSSGSEDDEARHAGPIPPGFSLVPSPMFGHGIMYMSHYLPPRGPAGCPTSMLADERRKRNRTFIDPVTEVPRLEYWFKRSTHPSHAVRINRAWNVIALICPSYGIRRVSPRQIPAAD